MRILRKWTFVTVLGIALVSTVVLVLWPRRPVSPTAESAPRHAAAPLGVIQNGISLSGSVLEESSLRGVANARVSVFQARQGAQTLLGEQITSATGAFAFAGLLPGQYTLTAGIPGRYTTPSPVEVTLSEGAAGRHVQIFVVACSMIEGKVVDAVSGDPLSNLTVEVFPQGGGQAQPILSKVEAGAFVVDGLLPGEYRLRLMDDHRRDAATPQVESVSELGRIYPVKFAVLVARGQVILDDGTPVSGATVSADYLNTAIPPQRVTTGREGDFSVVGLPAKGLAVLRASTEELVSEPVGPRPCAAFAAETHTLVLHRPASILGQVLREHDLAPCPAEVLLSSLSSYTPAERTASKDDGRFEFRGLPAGSYRLQAQALGADFGNRCDPLLVELLPGQQLEGALLYLRASGPGSIRGKIVDSLGQGIGEVLVLCTGRPADSSSELPVDVRRVNSDSAGEFLVEGLDDELLFALDFLHNDYSHVRIDNVTVDSETVRITLHPKGVIHLEAVDSLTTAPIPSFLCAVLPADYQMGDVEELPFIGRNGFATIRPVDHGPHAVVVKAAGYFLASTVVDVRKGPDPTEAAIALRPSSTLSGIVLTAEGVPVDGATVYFDSRMAPSDQLAKTDAAGRFSGTLPHLDVVALIARHAEFGIGFAPLNPDNFGFVTIRLEKTSRVEGTVSVGGRPLQGVEVRADKVKTITDANGAYALADIIPGEVALRAVLLNPGAASPRRTVRKTVNVPSGAVVKADFELQDTNCAVSGVLTAWGAPLPDCGMRLRINEEGIIHFFTTRTDAAGAYEFHAVPQGHAQLAASATLDGSLHEKLVSFHLVPSEQAEVNIDLKAGPVVTGRIEGYSGPFPVMLYAVPGRLAIERLDSATMEMVQESAAYYQRLDGNSFTLYGLDEGVYTLVALVGRRIFEPGVRLESHYQHTSALIDLANNEPLDVNLRF